MPINSKQEYWLGGIATQYTHVIVKCSFFIEQVVHGRIREFSLYNFPFLLLYKSAPASISSNVEDACTVRIGSAMHITLLLNQW